jgi:hypothetical protein
VNKLEFYVLRISSLVVYKRSFCWARLNHRTLSSPPPPNLETIASTARMYACIHAHMYACMRARMYACMHARMHINLDCFTKQTNIFIWRKGHKLINLLSALAYTYHIAFFSIFQLRSTTEQMPALVFFSACHELETQISK